jgi:hypothetical protein
MSSSPSGHRIGAFEALCLAGYPERFAQETLGHGSKAVTRAYAKKAHVVIPSLEDCEKKSGAVILPFQKAAAA